MNKLKSTFLSRRDSSQKSKHSMEKKRSQVFIERLAAEEQEAKLEGDTPKVKLEDLSEIEYNAYQTWWKDLDPFRIGKSDNSTVFKFVSGCQLPDSILEEILSLFQHQKDGLNQQQFFAILRLIAHAQNGRSVNRDIVYLGAPLPRFQTQALIKPSSVPLEMGKSCDAMESNSSWHGQLSLSYNSSSDSIIMAPPTLPSWIIPQPVIKQSPVYTLHHHSRSKSVPYPVSSLDPAPSPHDLYEFDTLGASAVGQNNRINRPGRASLDNDSIQKMMNTGRSLLLTQRFQPQFTTNEEDSISTNNPYIDNPYIDNPFDTDNSLVSTPKQGYTPPMVILPQLSPPYMKSSLNPNTCCNSKQMPPPPVPPQSTKPNFPKYARR